MRNVGKLVLVLALAGGLDCMGQVGGGAAAQQAQSPEFLTPVEGFTGMVRSPDGKPAAGVEVTLRPGPYPEAPDPYETKSDQNGRFVILLRRTGGHAVLPQTHIPMNTVLARDLAGNLAVMRDFPAEETPSNLDLTLEPGLECSSTIKDIEGAPITNATAELLMFRRLTMVPHSEGAMIELWKTASPDDRGGFSFAAMPKSMESYMVRVAAKGYGSEMTNIESAQLTTNRYQLPPFVLKRADRQLAGRVVSAEGTPVAGASVAFHGEGQPTADELTVQRVKTDNKGCFVFGSVCEGAINVYANTANTSGHVSCQGGDTNVVVRLNPPRR